jgi:orotate phosphoribosyltransferase-like protein
MDHLHDQEDLTTICAYVFDEKGLGQEEVAEQMGCSQVAVSYMIHRPDKSMGSLRKRFLREVAEVEIEGPGYYIDDSEGSLSLDDVRAAQDA